MENLKYLYKAICFQEIPNEISLGYSITGCPNKCKGCHSPELRADIGSPLLADLEYDILKNKDAISCVLFLGGDSHKQISTLVRCAEICKKYNLKTALYSGKNTLDTTLFQYFDYIKIGEYIEELGGLKSPKTNQRLYKKNKNKYEDITHLFWRKI